HLLHDGGSSDGSAELLRELPGLRTSFGPDEGMYDAINRCWLRAQGDILAYLNCDEQYLPGVLARVAVLFERHPRVDIIFGDAILLDASGRPVAWRRVLTPSRAHTRCAHLATMSCSMFFRRRLLAQGLFFDTRWKAIGDAEWVHRALGLGARTLAPGIALAAFALTGANLGASPAALEEAARWKAGAPGWQQKLTPALRLAHWLRKALHGAYFPRRFDSALYSPQNPARRQPTGPIILSPRWPSVPGR
ncbi:MAG: glycosyltransferase, partial [Terrimicrobiaceae bacterium]|nr:glycosyltransferase [Terrimicrobiaceae bacterium]